MALATKETLKDGKVLNALIDRFTSDRNVDNLVSVLRCLVDSSLCVPMNAIISKEDQEIMKNAKKGDELSLKHDVRMRPDWLKHDETGKVFFPIFANVNDAPEDYRNHFSWMELDIDNCISFADNNEECSGIILNAFTTPIAIQGEVYDVLKNMLKTTREEEAKEVEK